MEKKLEGDQSFCPSCSATTNQIVSLLGKLAQGFWLVQGLLTCAVCRFSCLKSEQLSWSRRKNTSRSEPLQISIFSPKLCWHPQPDVVSDVSYMLSSTPWNTKNAKLNFFFFFASATKCIYVIVSKHVGCANWPWWSTVIGAGLSKRPEDICLIHIRTHNISSQLHTSIHSAAASFW